MTPNTLARPTSKIPSSRRSLRDVKGFPPTLFITSGRDLLLSGTTILHRHFLAAGVDAQLVVFEALPHAFWNDVNLPESREAYGIMAKFFDSHLAKLNSEISVSRHITGLPA